MRSWWVIFLWGVVMCTACETQIPADRHRDWIEIPANFPSINFPEDNAYTPQRWELGKMLFNDPVFSVDSSLSCATCHMANRAFTTPTATVPGVFNRPGVRNAPTLANVAYAPYYLTEGSARTLELQVLVPIDAHNEFANTIQAIEQSLRNNPLYKGLAEQAYGRPMDAYVIVRAIANYERTFISGNSAYDAFENGDQTALNPDAKAGHDIFFSERAKCSQCHTPPLFTNYGFANNGLYEQYADSGRIHFTMKPEDRAVFKVPTLRNIAVTGPYMHNGSMNSLQEVVAHYSSGGKAHPNKSDLIQPLNLSPKEQQQLVAFMEALTDTAFLNNPRWQ